MKINNFRAFLTETNSQKVFDFLVQKPGNEFIEKEIQRGTGVSKPGVNLVLKELIKKGLIQKNKKGRMCFYKVENIPFVKQWKILKNISLLLSLVNIVNKLADDIKKIILFGSWSRGENDPESDIDIFVLTNVPKERIENIIKKDKFAKKIQLIVRTPVAFSEMEKKDPLFFNEISRGITILETKE